MYFLWTIKINCRRFLGRLSTNVIDTIAYTNSFWNQYFSVDQSDLRQRKQRIISYLLAWGSDRRARIRLSLMSSAAASTRDRCVPLVVFHLEWITSARFVAGAFFRAEAGKTCDRRSSHHFSQGIRKPCWSLAGFLATNLSSARIASL